MKSLTLLFPSFPFRQHLKLSFGLKLFSAIAIIFIPGFWLRDLTLSFAWLCGVFGWLLAEPPTHHPRQYLFSMLWVLLAFPLLGILFNLIPTFDLRIFFVVFISSLSLYLAGRFWFQSLGFAITFMATCYMAVVNYPAHGFYYWPVQLAAGGLFYALYSFVWESILTPNRTYAMPDAKVSANASKLALQLALSLSLTACVGQLIGLQHLFWALMTVGLVLREDVVSTLHRAKQRLFGTLLGCVYALLLLKLHLPTFVWLLLLSVLLPIAYAASHKWYLFSVSFYTVSVAFLAHYAGAQGNGVLWDRGLDTLLGAALAVTCVVLTSKAYWVRWI